MRILPLVGFLIAGICHAQQSSELSPIGAKIKAAMDSEIRSEQERARDANRRPIETLEVEDLDLALAFRNMHNPIPASRGIVNAAVFKALKPGGHYGVVDHTRRHPKKK